MHGRPRKPPTQEEQDASALKADKLRHLQSQNLHFHHNKIFTKEGLEISAKLLEVNPEHYTGWNYRKLAVQHFTDKKSENAAESESIQSILDEELRVVETALRANLKSYGAWHHRKWVLSKGHSSVDRELRLLGKFQKLDARNFHAWNYRRFVTALKKIPDEEELQYTTNMISDNFSNYSAWHNRSLLLSNLLEKGVKEYSEKGSVLREEYEFVVQALFTDPDDQSGWFYHLWLLEQTAILEPFLLSSWPSHSSKLYISANDYSSDQRSSPISHCFSKTREFPFILCFSEPMVGVSSSTVSIECDYLTCSELTWTPLSANGSGFAQAWLTYLKFTDATHTLEACPVKVAVAHFQGIINMSGTSCSQSSHLFFTVHIPSHDQNQAEEQTTDRISWKEENFCMYAAESHDADLLHSLCKLEMIRQKSKDVGWSMKVIADEIDRCRELLSLTECKIGKLTLARLLMANYSLVSVSCSHDRNDVHYEEILSLYDDLMKIDPSHICYYEDERSLVLLKQMTSSSGSFLKNIHHYRESTSSSLNLYSCLRLNSLSLSRIGSIEQLLWVQMLDLSHNKIRSTEGLEALQLLSCLNLSHNKICSFTALETLRLLKSLKVLGISYNEIGAHSIDTRRYLFSSPLNHALGSDWSGDIESLDHWDAFFIFKGLDLIQLDIMGNAAVNDRLKASLVKLMPALKWLDGESCN
ncbi:geranylgeranyl transferase type-2 subunit alpha 1-like [Primulina huaijiensis]|uniref:geranylgeranyl transferase type-2 subunit alpha 1-like n=1 Tax=Primulina huaijiensis TaxID=1492673 RepID=UPI003CC71946